MKKKAAVMFVGGQSNAHAHNQVMEEQDRIYEPLQNVFSLDRKENQSFDITDVVWSGYTTEGKNLGESQDHTYTLASFVAKRWQKAIEEGADLPDLYIVQISIGSQGIINGMWNPDKERVLKPGKLGVADIALFDLATHVYPLAMANLKKQGLEPVVVGFHWLGCEQEVWNETYLRADMQSRYDAFFDAMTGAIGEACPMYLYQLQLQEFCKKHEIPQEAVAIINGAMEKQCHRYPGSTFVRLDQCPHWDPTDEHKGVYAKDNGHYLAKTQAWFADRFWKDLEKIHW